MPRAQTADGKPRYKSLYFRNPKDVDAITERAKAAGLSFSEFVIRTARGDEVEGAESDRMRLALDDAKYWRERFEQMAAMAQDMQAEILQLRSELRLREQTGGNGEGAAAGMGDARATSMAPSILKVLGSLRSADGGWRVWTERELQQELDVDATDAVRVDGLRAALAHLFRMNLVEPQRNGWRYRG